MKKLFILTLLLVAFTAAPSLYAAEATETPAALQKKIQELKNERGARFEQKKLEVTTSAKNMAIAKIDSIIARYRKIKSRVEKMTVISVERKEALYTKINTEITRLEADKKQVQQAVTAAEVHQIMAQVKARIKNGSVTVKEAVGAIHATHLEGVAGKLTEVLNKLTAKVTELKNAGKDVAAMEALEVEAKVRLETAKEKITNLEFKAAKEDIVAARLKLVDLAQKIKLAAGEEE